jgi:membrane protease YdiL (CAAX protease family)
VVLLVLVARRFAGRPVLVGEPEPFRKVDPVGMAMLAFAIYIGQQSLAMLMPRPFAGAVILMVAIAIGVALLVFLRMRVTAEHGPVGRRVGQGVLVVWAALPVVYGSAFLVATLTGSEQPQQSVTYMLEREPGWQNMVVFAAVVAPLLEEAAFRGLLYPC